MFFSMARLSLTAAALVLPIYVQAVAFTVDSFKDMAVGKAKNLTWSGDGHPVTIKLMQGDPEDLEPVVNLASNVEGDHYTWTPTTLPSGTYVLSITQGTETNYSPQFDLSNSGPGGAPPPIRAGTTKPPPAATAALALPGSTHPPKLTASPTAPPTKAAVALALPPPGATLPPPVLPSAHIAAYNFPNPGFTRYEKDNNDNDRRSQDICELTNIEGDYNYGYGNSGIELYSCSPSLVRGTGSYDSTKFGAAAGGVVRKGKGKAAVVGLLGFAVVLVL